MERFQLTSLRRLCKITVWASPTMTSPRPSRLSLRDFSEQLTLTVRSSLILQQQYGLCTNRALLMHMMGSQLCAPPQTSQSHLPSERAPLVKVSATAALTFTKCDQIRRYLKKINVSRKLFGVLMIRPNFEPA